MRLSLPHTGAPRSAAHAASTLVPLGQSTHIQAKNAFQRPKRRRGLGFSCLLFKSTCFLPWTWFYLKLESQEKAERDL